MHIFLVSKIAKNSTSVNSRYIYANDSDEAEEIYRSLMHFDKECTLSISTIGYSGMLLANRDAPDRLKSSVKIYTNN